MAKITKFLEKTYRNRALNPVIVKASPGKFVELKAQLRQVVPVHLLESSAKTLFPRIFRIFEVPFSKWKEIPTFDMIATVLTPDLIEELETWNVVEKVYPDFIKWALAYPTVPAEGRYVDRRMKVFTTTYWIKKLLGLDRANAQGYDGARIRVLVTDTGCRVTLPQVRHVKVISAMREKGGIGDDANGHGTHVVSTLGGLPTIDPNYNVRVEGMAPACDLWSCQVLGFIIGTGTTSDVIEGMEMAVKIGAKVVSMSLGSEEAPPDAENPEAEVINYLTERGIICSVAAGNSGPDPSTIGSPGSCLNSLTVGALDPFTGEVASFSSRGPTSGDEYIKPDVVSYGVMLDSQCTGLIDAMTDPTQKNYSAISGTSMATPTVSGLVTCMAQLYRDTIGKELTTHEVKRMMEALGEEKNNDTGWGLIHWGLVERWVETEYGVKLG